VRARRDAFLETMDDDFNTGGAIGEIHILLRELNRFADAAALERTRDEHVIRDLERGAVVLKEMLHILGLFRRPARPTGRVSDRLTAPLLDLLVQLRSKVRKEKNFTLADEIRTRLAELGVVLEDRPDGTAWTIEQVNRST
jgi:cysteinyl-tRNA synthetase